MTHSPSWETGRVIVTVVEELQRAPVIAEYLTTYLYGLRVV